MYVCICAFYYFQACQKNKKNLCKNLQMHTSAINLCNKQKMDKFLRDIP